MNNADKRDLAADGELAPIPMPRFSDYPPRDKPPDDDSKAAQGAPEAAILALLEARRVIYANPPPEPVTTFSLAGQSISTAGNLTVISAQAKAGKTAAIAAMIAAAISTGIEADCLGFDAAPTHGKAILVFDTEQSPFDAWTQHARVLKRAGCAAPPDNLHHFWLLDLSISQRRQAIFEYCRRAAQETGVFAVFIDGVADLIEDVNDAAEANALVSDLVRLAVEINAPVDVVLHENPAAPGVAGKTRGHLGSQLERKAESNLRILKDTDGVTTIYSEKCRRANIPQHSGPRFQWEDEAQMHISVASKGHEKAEKAKKKDESDLAEIFESPEALGGMAHAALLARIMAVFDLTKSGARFRFDKLKAMGMIHKTSQGLWIR
jgi:hypothetical protein